MYYCGMQYKEQDVIVVLENTGTSAIFRRLMSLLLLLGSVALTAYCYWYSPSLGHYFGGALLILIFGWLAFDNYAEDRFRVRYCRTKYRFESSLGTLHLTRGWKPLPETEYVSVFYQLHRDEDGEVTGCYNVNVWQEGNRHLTVFADYNVEVCLKIAQKIAIGLNVPLLDATIKNNSVWVRLDKEV